MRTLFAFVFAAFLGGVVLVSLISLPLGKIGEIIRSVVGDVALAAETRAVTSPYVYVFNVPGTLVEAGTMGESSSPYWWLNSGGLFLFTTNGAKTVQGELAAQNPWRVLYNQNNPVDTDNGYHPQNLFRLVTRSMWNSFRQETYIKVNKDNLSQSPNRNQSNGILLMSRYQADGQTLYYTGLRVDGSAVIKKKLDGKYYTLALKPFYSSPVPGMSYDRDKNPNYIPKNTWIGLRSEVKNNPDGSVNIKLYVDNGRTGKWVLAAEATDNGTSYGRTLTTGYAGIRTDFMDIEVNRYRIDAM